MTFAGQRQRFTAISASSHEGRETHNGVELNAEGKAANWLRLNGSAEAMNATSTDTGTPSFDNKQVINVPHLHTTVFADLTVPHIRGLHLMPGWSYTSRKEATRDDAVSVPELQPLQSGRALHARRRAGPRHVPHLRR